MTNEKTETIKYETPKGKTSKLITKRSVVAGDNLDRFVDLCNSAWNAESLIDEYESVFKSVLERCESPTDLMVFIDENGNLLSREQGIEKSVVPKHLTRYLELNFPSNRMAQLAAEGLSLVSNARLAVKNETTNLSVNNIVATCLKLGQLRANLVYLLNEDDVLIREKSCGNLKSGSRSRSEEAADARDELRTEFDKAKKELTRNGKEPKDRHVIDYLLKEKLIEPRQKVSDKMPYEKVLANMCKYYSKFVKKDNQNRLTERGRFF